MAYRDLERQSDIDNTKNYKESVEEIRREWREILTEHEDEIHNP